MRLDKNQLIQNFLEVRRETQCLCDPLEIEDYGVQPMEDASPPKWHLAHTTWFFEVFVLKPHVEKYVGFNEQYKYLFNSYYDGVGERYPRSARGNLSRPTVAEVMEYRSYVDQKMEEILLAGPSEEIERLVILGLEHEKQHQELILTDLKFNLGHNPLRPAYRNNLIPPQSDCSESNLDFIVLDGGMKKTGVFSREVDFCFDNETPKHRVWIDEFAIASRLVTNGEYLHFIEEEGYKKPTLWLSEGWSSVQNEHWEAPEYWYKKGDVWFEYTLGGGKELDLNLPVTHVSFYEADAFARWSGARLPTEFEWEAVASTRMIEINEANLMNSDRFHPESAKNVTDISQLFGDCWEWTSSNYRPYPGYKALEGTLGEYNGKFMSNQMVLRGGSCVTSNNHIRDTYRNFFYPADRWQFSGIRLAKDV